MFIRVERFEFNGDFVLRTKKVMCRLGIDVITLARDTDVAIANDFAPARVGHASLDAIIEILPCVARCFECKAGFPGRIGLERFALDDLALTPIPAAPTSFGIHILIKPRIIVRPMPIMVKRILINHNLHARIRHRAAKVIVSLNVHFDFLTDAESFLLTVFLRCLDADLEFRQFVFFQSEERGRANLTLLSGVPESNVIFAQRHRFAELQRTPGAAVDGRI